jgi:hypothetical protein
MKFMRLTRFDLLAIVAAINSAGDTLTVEEAREQVATHGGNPDWVDAPPEWVDEINAALRKSA